MGTATFFALITSECLHFSSLSTYQDQYEGVPPKEWVQYLTSKNKLGPMVTVDQATQTAISQLKRARDATFVSCWHQAEEQSDGMWRIYSKMNEGVAIRSTTARLRSAIKDKDGEFYEGLVRYDGLHNNPYTTLPAAAWALTKRPSFSHEREYRLIAYREFVNSFSATVDLNLLISEIGFRLGWSRGLWTLSARSVKNLHCTHR